MHVWEKFSSNLTPNLAAEKALSLGTWPTGVAGLKPDFTISYSDAIGKANGEVVLADPVKTYHVRASSDYKNLNFLRGNTLKKHPEMMVCSRLQPMQRLMLLQKQKR